MTYVYIMFIYLIATWAWQSGGPKRNPNPWALVTRYLSNAEIKNSRTWQTAISKAQVLLRWKDTLNRKVWAAQKDCPELSELLAFVFFEVGCPKAIQPASWSRLVSLATWMSGGGPRPSVLSPGIGLFLKMGTHTSK